MDSTNELVLLLRVWQDNRQNTDLHGHVVRTVQCLVRAAVAATHSCAVNREQRCKDTAHSKATYLAPIKGRLVKTLYQSKAVSVLVAEMINNEGVCFKKVAILRVSIDVIYNLCLDCSKFCL